MSRIRRTELLSVEFVNGLVEGWVFGVGDFFRMQLDIRLDERIDTVANKVKEARLGRKLEASEKLKRSVWTQGSRPAYSFDRGHLFHELNTSTDGVRRSLVVLLARPDPGALVESRLASEEGIESTVVSENDIEGSVEGFVDYEVLTYKHGVLNRDDLGLAIKERSSRTQIGFVNLLRTGT